MTDQEQAIYVVIVETQIDAEERAGEPAFLARLDLDSSGAVEHQFGLEVVNNENRRAFAMVAKPGEIFAARRWWWTGNELDGGDVSFTLSAVGAVYPFTQEEAVGLLCAGAGASRAGLGNRRTAPGNVLCRLASSSGKPVLRGDR